MMTLLADALAAVARAGSPGRLQVVTKERYGPDIAGSSGGHGPSGSSSPSSPR